MEKRRRRVGDAGAHALRKSRVFYGRQRRRRPKKRPAARASGDFFQISQNNGGAGTVPG
jgi:hypothetical protein